MLCVLVVGTGQWPVVVGGGGQRREPSRGSPTGGLPGRYCVGDWRCGMRVRGEMGTQIAGNREFIFAERAKNQKSALENSTWHLPFWPRALTGGWCVFLLFVF